MGDIGSIYKDGEYMKIPEHIERAIADSSKVASEIEMFSSFHTEEEWIEYGKKQLLDGGFSEQQIQELFYYDASTHEFYPTEELMARWDNERHIAEEMRNLFLKAKALGISSMLPASFQENTSDEETELDETDCSEPISPEENEQRLRFATHIDRLKQLSVHGLDAANFHSSSYRYVDSSYSIDGFRYNCCSTLYHNGKEVGLFFDEYSDADNRFPHERHVDKLLEVVRKNRISLLLIYWEKDGAPIWEMYFRGHFIRQQPTIYTYEGYLYDKEKVRQIYKLSKGESTDIGLLLNALHQLNVEADKIANLEEKEIRIRENAQQHTELTELVSKMQQHVKNLGAVFRQTKFNGELTADQRDTFYKHLDAVTDAIPQAVAMRYEEKAKKEYPFYSNVAASSQRFLRTAVALEESLTEEQYDICPLYFELCRVFENELDIRIFSEYIGRLASGSLEEMQNSGNEFCFKKIRELVEKAVSNSSNPNARIFVPEKIKVLSLNKTKPNSPPNSYYQGTLLNLLEEKNYDIALLARTSEYNKNRAYVEDRNKFVHPDDKLSDDTARLELHNIKERTKERLNWLIQATENLK